MGALCSSCCTAGTVGSAYDEEERGLLNDAANSRSEEARRKAAEAALRRAGALAQRARPEKPRGCTGARHAMSNGMRWDGG